MKTTRLGKTELEVSRVGFGGIPIQRLTEADAIRVVQRCLDLGVTFLDTANAYTTSEERIGKALADSAVQREQVVIATKTGARDKAGAQEHLELSLNRLQTDYIDLWQFHGVSTLEAYEQVLGPGGAMEAAQTALQAGKVRHIGVTSHSMDAMKPFAGGMLDNANLAIKYLLQFDNVLPDPGVEASAEIEEIVDIVTGDWELTPQERQEMECIRAEVGTRFCRRCEYCQPCPEGVRISLVVNVHSFWKRFPIERFSTGWIAQGMASGRNCIECGECETKCPYHLPIREMIVENLAFYDSVIS
jgi:predicted aldo/keto reductase-like oxidoreductase